jgi:hypothetical protein
MDIPPTLGIAIGCITSQPRPCVRKIGISPMTVVAVDMISGRARLSPAFMTNWELLWWLIPMTVVGGLFRRHLSSRVPREVEKNLLRLTSQWSEVTAVAIADLKGQAITWVLEELTMLRQILAQRPEQAAAIREGLSKLE